MQAGAFIHYLETNMRTSFASGGSQLVVHDDCPFCGRSDGKIYVDVRKELGCCFLCGRGFNPLLFVAENEGVNFGKAREILEGTGSIYQREELAKPEGQKGWFPATEPLVGVSLAYMQQRGFDASFCAKMGLRFCRVNTEVDKHLYYTANRIIIPIFNRQGRLDGWQGRDITGVAKPKYLIQPGFDAKQSLYNSQRVIPGLPVVVVEGVMDVFGWARAGVTNVVATWGKKISAEQIALLIDLKPSCVYIAWDGDATKGRFDFAENYQDYFKIKIVSMGSKDADELAPAELRYLIETASSYDWQKRILESLVKI